MRFAMANHREPDFLALGGSLRAGQRSASLALLPGQIFIPAAQGVTGRLGRMIDLLAEECRSSHPGKDLIVRRMLEVLLVEALRWAGGDHSRRSCGAAGGLARPRCARADGHARRYSG
jgi:hypothetical protein